MAVGSNGVGSIGEAVALGENLGAHADVDARALVIHEAAAIDMACAETDAGESAVDVGPAVVVIGHMEGADVLLAIVVRVPDQAPLPVVAELAPADSDKVRGALDIQKAVEMVFVAGNALGRHVAVVDPDLGGLLEADDVLALWRVMELQIPNDNIAYPREPEP